ncbi:lytic transglycosylase domain-containing protein [Variovorax sp.]|uniref:lytic transglycosylase domain-containing protein n=1 Tax=Variovorax sp. TaxID=1871043 RepID=UPI002D6E89CE|nr:transglycosylase SLT domain-containing protein [Variovorax sp.]HYP83473.1 transglycosylase SLT domain-containing protein [Variovorax sp.]
MQLQGILAPGRARLLATVVWGVFLCTGAQAQQSGAEDALLQMKQAYQRGDKATLAALLPQVQGHPLEAWGAYWELKARLAEASPLEVQDFFARYRGSYQEDRLRNDWLLVLGKLRDWDGFLAAYPAFRMRDDREVRCYATLASALKGQPVSREMAAEVRTDWLAQRDADDGCLTAAELLLANNRLSPDDAWMKARQAMESKRSRAARDAVNLVAPDALPMFDQLNANPARFLSGRAVVAARASKEMVVLALIKTAVSDPDVAARQLDSKWSPMLSAEERNWLWGVIGRQSAMSLSPQALGYFGNVTRVKDLSDDMLAWKVRSALRMGQWRDVQPAIEAMDAETQREPVWVYWKARALMQRGGDMRREEARELYQSIAGTGGFYEMLALEELGQRSAVPTPPAPLTEQERQAARQDPGLQRGLLAINLGLRSEGVREWNYTVALHTPGGMSDRELLAAADLACQYQVWDRCINTSERTKGTVDVQQRFPMPFHDAVIGQSRAIGLEPAYVYGLIRQESRFIMSARSGVGASGLMQVMPATARWTARKIGLAGFTPDQIYERDTNILIGTSYLKLALDDFEDSMPLAAAAYNAGPGRPRAWRNGPPVEAAIWAENVPFNETRDYVKKVLANTTMYAAIISGQPQSIKARLGTVGPRPASDPEPNKDLP